MVAILIENSYARSLWCEKMHLALVERLRAKRIAFCEIYDTCSHNIKTVFIIGSNQAWLSSTIKQFNKNNVVPIVLCNQLDAMPGCVYNCVCSDITASMNTLLNLLKSKNKKKVAIYGVNPSSLSDISRADTLMVSKDESIEKMTLFLNEGSLTECFDEFYSVANEYDCVICANDFAAISLIKRLKLENGDLLKNLLILSCTSSKLLDCYREHIISLDVNYKSYGKAAVYIYEALQKHKFLSGLTVKVEWDLSSSYPPPSGEKITLNQNTVDDCFYNDPELVDMLIVDRLYTFSDDLDKKILDSLINGLSIEEISQECFLSVNAIKYRIKNLVENSGAKDKSQIINLLKEYRN